MKIGRSRNLKGLKWVTVSQSGPSIPRTPREEKAISPPPSAATWNQLRKYARSGGHTERNSRNLNQLRQNVPAAKATMKKARSIVAIVDVRRKRRVSQLRPAAEPGSDCVFTGYPHKLYSTNAV